jgi:hypothetical protein
MSLLSRIFPLAEIVCPASPSTFKPKVRILNFILKFMPEEEPRPQPTDAVLGGTGTQPRPYDAVLGGKDAEGSSATNRPSSYGKMD